MAEYDTDEERITAIMDFLKRNQKFILLTFGAVFFTAITSLSVSSYYTNQNAQAAKLYDAWSIVESDEKIDPEQQAAPIVLFKKTFLKLVMLVLHA
jgi:predicted negative regulator of RcsB-dependent stress response